MAEKLGTVTHCLFDMDGLLLDTETLYTVAQQQILDRFNLTFTWELKSRMMGLKALPAAQILVDALGLAGQLTAEQFLLEREELLDQLFPTSPLMPGAERLLRHLHAQGVPMAVATSSHRRHYELKTAKHRDLFSLFSHVITGDQVQQGKPHPEIFVTAAATFAWPAAQAGCCNSDTQDAGAASRAGPAPSCCLVFEDAPSGVAAAVAAGMPCVMVPDPNLNPALCTQAQQVLRSLEEFRPEQWGLPPFPDTPS